MLDGIIERYLCLMVCRVHDRSSNVPRRVMILSEIAQYAVNYSVGYKVRHPVYMRAKTVVGGRTIDVGFFSPPAGACSPFPAIRRDTV